MKQIIYIAGYGRSGSTLLDILLSQSKSIASAGAMSNMAEWYSQDSLCACGDSINTCPVWSEIIHQFKSKYGKDAIGDYERLRLKYESRKMLFISLWTDIRANPEYCTYLEYTSFLLSLVFDCFNTDVIIDSSKNSTDSALRVRNLSNIQGVELKVIHLIRDPRGCIYSLISGKGSPERKRAKLPKIIWALRAVNGWIQANAYAMYCIRSGKIKNSVVLKYEDLALNTNSSISYISSAIDTNLDDIESIIGNNKEIFPGHNLGGNRLRFSSEISIKYDQRWEKELGFFYRYIVVLPCFLFVNLFGYSLSSYEKKNRI